MVRVVTRAIGMFLMNYHYSLTLIRLFLWYNSVPSSPVNKEGSTLLSDNISSSAFIPKLRDNSVINNELVIRMTRQSPQNGKLITTITGMTTDMRGLLL